MSKLVGAAPMPSIRAKSQEKVDQVFGFLERQIDQARVKPGEKIATERELARQFGASRSVVRLALAQLHKTGKIVRKVGHGTVVQALAEIRPASVSLNIADVSPLELLEFRLAFEPGLAEAITLNASDNEIRVLLDCVEAGDNADGWEAWERCDRQFHQSLVAASHNRLAIGVYHLVIGIRHERPWLNKKQGHTDPSSWQRYQAEHRRIAEALAQRDPIAGAQSIRDHLLKVKLKMLGV